jgi:hypothetical protein
MRLLLTTLTRAAAVVAILGLAVGCTETNRPVVKVEGTIKTSDGKLLPAGTKMLFNPTEGRTGTASATTEADGSFKLTHVSGTAGAEIGKYTVLLTPPSGGEKEFYKYISKSAAEDSLFAEIKDGMGPLNLTVKTR